MGNDQNNQRPSNDVESIKKRAYRPKKVVVTGGMPYANGPVHLGHLAGALIPPDICARYNRMLIGAENVMFVCGNDDHGSTSELAALKSGKPIREFIDTIHNKQAITLKNYNLSLDTFSGTSRQECLPIHKELCQNILRKLNSNNLLDKKSSMQWFDIKLQRFLQDRFVNGSCPNPKCDNKKAYSDSCDECGTHYDPSELIDPLSTLSDTSPELKETTHWWLNLWKVSDQLREWVITKQRTWRSATYKEVYNTVLPSLCFANTAEQIYKDIKSELPKHKSKYAAGKKVQLQFENSQDLEKAKKQLRGQEVESDYVDGWAHRSISRDVAWGIPMPVDIDPDMEGKTLYVWPDSLIAPISFTQVALKKAGKNAEDYKKFWCDPKAKIYQFLGQDNVYFYTLMQGALWIGSQDSIERLPVEGELQLTEIFGSYHLWVEGQKMSKSTGNFMTGDELLEKYSADQIRYFLSTLTLADKNSNFEIATLEDRNKFLAGPMNAAFEKPISACQSQFESKVPQGELNPKIKDATEKLLNKYFKSMEKSEYSVLLGQIENYARQINSLFTQYKPHDDRLPEKERKDALYTCFYVLKNIMIMLYPFVPSTMDKLRKSLNLPTEVFNIEGLGTGIEPGHLIGDKQEFFPS